MWEVPNLNEWMFDALNKTDMFLAAAAFVVYAFCKAFGLKRLATFIDELRGSWRIIRYGNGGSQGKVESGRPVLLKSGAGPGLHDKRGPAPQGK